MAANPDDSNPIVLANFFFFGSIFPGANRRNPELSGPSENAGGRRPPPAGEWKGWPWDFSSFPHEDFGPQINYAIWMLTALAGAFLALRLYCKFLRHRGLWWDDHILILSFIFTVAQTSFISYTVSIGYGQHIWDFHPKDLQTFLFMSNTGGFFSILAAMLSKTSFAMTVLRISDGWTRRFIWFIIVSMNVILGFAAIDTYAQCSPAEKVWRPMLLGNCWPKEFIINYNIFTAAYSGAMDIILALLPWRIIWKMTINKKEKLGVMTAMSMGVFAGAISFAKITQLPAINKADLILGLWLSILATAEPTMTIMAASIPVLRALVRKTDPQRPVAPVRFVNNTEMMYAGGTNAGGNNTTHMSRSDSVLFHGNLNNNMYDRNNSMAVTKLDNRAFSNGRNNSSSIGSNNNRQSHGVQSRTRPNPSVRRTSGSSTRSWAQRLHVSRTRETEDEEWFYRLEAGQLQPPQSKIEAAEETSVKYEDRRSEERRSRSVIRSRSRGLSVGGSRSKSRSKTMWQEHERQIERQYVPQQAQLQYVPPPLQQYEPQQAQLQFVPPPPQQQQRYSSQPQQRYSTQQQQQYVPQQPNHQQQQYMPQQLLQQQQQYSQRRARQPSRGRQPTRSWVPLQEDDAIMGRAV